MIMASAEAQARTDTDPAPAIPSNGHDLFSRLAGWTIRVTGGRWGFFFALGTVVIWTLLGPFCHYSENWQLVINTGTTIVTFLMVFLIQNAQNRESKAIHLKLDELIRAVQRARNELIDIEHLSEQQLDEIAGHFTRLAGEHREGLETLCTVKAPNAPT
jgi:low affinity Fe/Cu permease